MLHRKLAEPRGFRQLTAQELEAVSGGLQTIIVTGSPQDNPAFWWAGGGAGLGGNGNETGNNPNPALGGDAGNGPSFEPPIIIIPDPETNTITLSGPGNSGTLEINFDLETIDVKSVNLNIPFNGNTITGTVDFENKVFGSVLTVPLSNGIIGQLEFFLKNDGSFSKVVAKLTIVLP